MHYIEIEIGDGSDNDPYQLPKLSNHTIVRVTRTGTDSELFLQLPADCDVNDLFEFYTINNVRLSVFYPVNEQIFGTATADPYRTVLSLRKVSMATGDEINGYTPGIWLGSQSENPTSV